MSRAYNFTLLVRLGRRGRRAAPLLRSSLRLLNVRLVIYTRGFTARETLRKALTRAARRTGDARLPRTKNHFLRAE